MKSIIKHKLEDEYKMLDGDKYIKNDFLKIWSSSLDIKKSGYPENCDQYKIIDLQLQLFKCLVSELKPNEYWKKPLLQMSQSFMDAFIRTKRNAIHIANYYECFVICANIETKKKIIQGYSETENIGEVGLYDGKKKVGSIGQKSNLIWSVYYPYFIKESSNGVIYHTLANHHEILTLQLWNVENKQEEEIIDYIDNILVKLSMQKDLSFKKINPIREWLDFGHAKIYGLQVPRRSLESIPLKYLNYAITCEDPRMAFLHYYQVIEFFFVRAQNEKVISEFHSEGIFNNSKPIDHGLLRRILKSYTSNARELESLKLVLQKAIDVQKFKNYINEQKERKYLYTCDISINEKMKINLKKPDKAIIDKYAERIYTIRCAIAHAKGDIDEYLAIPTLNDSDISRELPLLKIIAYKVLLTWGQ